MIESSSTRRKRALVVGALTALIWFTIPLLTGSFIAAGLAATILYIVLSIFWKSVDADRRA